MQNTNHVRTSNMVSASKPSVSVLKHQIQYIFQHVKYVQCLYHIKYRHQNIKYSVIVNKYQPSGTRGTCSPSATPAKSKMTARGPQNGLWSLERCLSIYIYYHKTSNIMIYVGFVLYCFDVITSLNSFAC